MGICVSCRRRERKAPEKRSAPTAGGLAKGAAAELLPRRDRLPAPVMANSMSNIKMTNPIKNMVSKRRRRYTKDGFNLDLTYITDRVIAMGFPAEKLESMYRNHIDEVYRFLEKFHRDHYKIYNLCSEKTYDTTKFHSRVMSFPFEDHTPPNLGLIQPFCEDVHEWLSKNDKNIAAVHCKAGKGRTGTMVCCYLLFSGQMATADDALKYYGTKRTHDEKGVTIPSQRRYVEYYAELLRSGLQYSAPKVHIRELIMSPPPTLNGSHFSPELTVSQAYPSYKTPSNSVEVHREPGAVRVLLPFCTPLFGDVRVDVYNKKPKMKMRKEKLFHFWFNTFFVAKELGAHRVQPLPDSPNQEAFKLTLNKWQLDDAHKDKQHKLYSPDFKVELIILKVPETSKFTGASESGVPLHSSSSSSCSEADTEPDGHWDSGEHLHIPYRRLAESRDRFYADESPEEPTGRLFVVGDRDSPSDGRASSPDSDADGSPPPPMHSADNRYSDGDHSPPPPTQSAVGRYCDGHRSPPPPTQSAVGDYRDGRDSPPPPTQSADDHHADKGKHDADDKKKCAFFHKNEEGLSRPRFDVRASWREFSGKFASDNRKKKNKDDVS